MIIKTPYYYKKFKCIAGDCPDSCCQGWEVDADSDSLKYYSTLTGDIKKRIDSVLDKDEFSNTIFRLTDKKRCPFLNSDNLCDMHIAIGAEHTPYTCRMFPRFVNDFGATREIGLSLSCPVAADIIFSLTEPFSLVSESDDSLPALNDIDAETYYFLKKARQKAFSMLEDKNAAVSECLAGLLDYGVYLQRQLDDYSDGGKDDVSFFDVFKNPELINPEWNEKVANGREVFVSNNNYNKNIADYFIYRYFLLAVNDYDVLSKIKMAAVGVLIAEYFGADSWTMHLWSKETEHSQYNMDRYKSLLKSAECLSVSSLKERLSAKP